MGKIGRKEIWRRGLMGRRGLADAALYVYGFFLLFCYILLLILLSFFGGGSFQEELDVMHADVNGVSLFAYIQNVQDFNDVRVNVGEMIINSYYTGDYNRVDKITKEVFNGLYPRKGCLTWNIEFVLQPDGREVHAIRNYHGENMHEKSVLLPLDGDKKIEVRYSEIC